MKELIEKLEKFLHGTNVIDDENPCIAISFNYDNTSPLRLKDMIEILRLLKEVQSWDLEEPDFSDIDPEKE